MIITNLPDLDGDEGVLAEIPNVEVKSIDFRLFLTNKRLLLLKDNGGKTSPVIVPLQVIRSVGKGTNFADDPVLKLSLSAPDGSQKKMVIAFTQEFSGIRDKERDQLKKVLEGVISESRTTVRTAPKPPQSGFPGGDFGFGQQSQPGQPYQNPGDFGQAPARGPGDAILTAANVVVKSQEYTVSLTIEKITLTDPNRTNKPSSIPLAAVRSAEGETGDQGEPAIALLVEAQNGNIRRMVLKFSQWYDKNRWGERETWTRAIQDILATGSVGELYRPTEAECTPQSGFVPPQGGFSARPPGFGGSPDVCPQCNAPLPPGSKFCGNCGSSIADHIPNPQSHAPNPDYSMSSGGIIDSEPYGAGDPYGSDTMYAPAPQKRRAPKKKARVKKAPRRRKPAGEDIFGKSGGGPLMSENSAAGRLIGFITSPGRTYQMTKGQDAVDAAPVFIISILIFALGNTLFLNWYTKSLDPATYPVLSTFAEFGTAFFFAVEMAVFLAVMTLIYGVLLHLSVGILGYRSEINDGIRIAMYSSVAFIAGGIIPVIGIFLMPLWAFYLQFTGIGETYDLSGMQALIAAAIPAVLALIVFYFFIISGESSFAIFGGA